MLTAFYDFLSLLIIHLHIILIQLTLCTFKAHILLKIFFYCEVTYLQTVLIDILRSSYTVISFIFICAYFVNTSLDNNIHNGNNNGYS